MSILTYPKRICKRQNPTGLDMSASQLSREFVPRDLAPGNLRTWKVSPFQPFAAVGRDKTKSEVGNPVVAGGPIPEALPRKKRILHVEFDRVLLTTRHVLLETAGFEVVSCFSSMAAREVSAANRRFDLFLVGHAASVHERTDLIMWIRAQFPGIAIVVLRSRDIDFSPAGDVLAVADPDELLKAIVDVLGLR